MLCCQIHDPRRKHLSGKLAKMLLNRRTQIRRRLRIFDPLRAEPNLSVYNFNFNQLTAKINFGSIVPGQRGIGLVCQPLKLLLQPINVPVYEISGC